METQRVVFFGSGNFGQSILQGLLTIPGLSVVGVVSGPDRIQGRGLQLSTDPVAALAQSTSIPIWQTDRITDALQGSLRSLSPDAAVLASFGLMIPSELLRLPRLGFVNVHPSLLPAYRGASPIAGALLDGQSETGSTLIVMTPGLDDGPIIAQESVSIPHGMHRPDLERVLIDVSVGLLRTSLLPYLAGRITPVPQADPRGQRPTRRLSKEQGRIHWTKDAESIVREIRAFDPWPGSWTTWNGEMLKILDARPTPTQPGAPGTVLTTPNDPMSVVCGSGSIGILRLQRSGRKPLNAKDFLHGSPGILGSQLGTEFSSSSKNQDIVRS